MKKYVLIAGVNGAGKSTLFQILPSLQGMQRINTDEILKEFGDWRNTNDMMTAGKIAVKKIQECFVKGISFNQETTLCGKSVLRNIIKAKEKHCSLITLEVNERNSTAIHLYKKHGFETVGIRKKYYDNKFDAYIMTKYL